MTKPQDAISAANEALNAVTRATASAFAAGVPYEIRRRYLIAATEIIKAMNEIGDLAEAERAEKTA